MKNEDDVVKYVGKLAKLFGRDITGEVIDYFAEILLSRLTPDEACSAILKWSESETRWPAPAQVIEMVRPKTSARDVAGELSMDLMRLIAQKGYTWESTFRYDNYGTIEEAIVAEAGHEALAVVTRCGGWASFCREWGGEQGDTSARAQLRGLCEAAVNRTMSNAAGLLSSSPRKALDPVGEFISQQKELRAKKGSLDS